MEGSTRAIAVHGLIVAGALTLALVFTRRYGLPLVGWPVACMVMAVSAQYAFVPKVKRSILRTILALVLAGSVMTVMVYVTGFEG